MHGVILGRRLRSRPHAQWLGGSGRGTCCREIKGYQGIFNCVPRAGALALQNGELDLCSLNLGNVPSADMEASGCKDARDGGSPQHLRTTSLFNRNTLLLFCFENWDLICSRLTFGPPG